MSKSHAYPKFRKLERLQAHDVLQYTTMRTREVSVPSASKIFTYYLEKRSIERGYSSVVYSCFFQVRTRKYTSGFAELTLSVEILLAFWVALSLHILEARMLATLRRARSDPALVCGRFASVVQRVRVLRSIGCGVGGGKTSAKREAKWTAVTTAERSSLSNPFRVHKPEAAPQGGAYCSPSIT